MDLALSLFGEKLDRYKGLSTPAQNACHLKSSGLVPALEMETCSLALQCVAGALFAMLWEWGVVSLLWFGGGSPKLEGRIVFCCVVGRRRCVVGYVNFIVHASAGANTPCHVHEGSQKPWLYRTLIFTLLKIVVPVFLVVHVCRTVDRVVGHTRPFFSGIGARGFDAQGENTCINYTTKVFFFLRF